MKRYLMILMVLVILFSVSCAKKPDKGPEADLFIQTCQDIFEQEPQQIIEGESVFSDSESNSEEGFPLHYEAAPFYLFLPEDLILDHNGIMVRYIKHTRGDDFRQLFRFEITESGTRYREFSPINPKDPYYDLEAEKEDLIGKYINEEIDFRYNWYKDMNGTEDATKLGNKNYSWSTPIEINGIEVPNAEYESEYKKKAGEKNIYKFDFKIPAATNSDSKPYFIYDWRPYGLNSMENGYGFLYNRELQYHDVQDDVCSYVYGTARCYDDCTIIVMGYVDSDEVRTKVDSFCEAMGIMS